MIFLLPIRIKVYYLISLEFNKGKLQHLENELIEGWWYEVFFLFQAIFI